MARKDGKKQEETVRIRLSADLLGRCRAVQGPSGWGSEAETSFLRHLIDMGLQQKEFEDKRRKVLEEVQLGEAVKQVRQEEKEDFEREELLRTAIIEESIRHLRGEDDSPPGKAQ
jgi:hypothetical protein